MATLPRQKSRHDEIKLDRDETQDDCGLSLILKKISIQKAKKNLPHSLPNERTSAAITYSAQIFYFCKMRSLVKKKSKIVVVSTDFFFFFLFLAFIHSFARFNNNNKKRRRTKKHNKHRNHQSIISDLFSKEANPLQLVRHNERERRLAVDIVECALDQRDLVLEQLEREKEREE